MKQPVFEIKKEKGKKKEKNYGKLAISPLERGYGDTLGNSLRRVLLTSLSGAAITSIKISGVKHQFQTLKGMKEDVVELVLNLKKVRITGLDLDKPVKATLEAVGPGEVKAGDIKTSSSVKIANPDLVLATLNKEAKLSANLTIENGTGYSPAADRKVKELGLIPLDASFSPITRVNYSVEETRVGRLTNFDKLVLEIWTNGTVNAKDAVVNAAEILVGYFNQIVNPVKIVEKEEDKEEETLGPVGKLSVEEIGLPTRVANALVKAGYHTVEDLAKGKRKELAKVRNLGEKSVKIIEVALGEKDVKIMN